MAFKVGIIYDTYGLLRPEALVRLSGVDHIIHGGDIGGPNIIPALRDMAPGHCDPHGRLGPRNSRDGSRPARRWSIFVLHLKPLRFDPVGAGIDVIVSGHSHVPKIDEIDGVLYLNPGSTGRRRFKLPITLSTNEIEPHALSPIIHDLVDR
jgi:uncharacterized protein